MSWRSFGFPGEFALLHVRLWGNASVLVARSQIAELPHDMNLALDSGVTPKELSEIITHPAFYAGWTNAMSAVAVAHDIFAWRPIYSRHHEGAALLRKDRNMDITRAGSQSSIKGPADWFTGAVRIDPLFAANEARRGAGGAVTFEPGARTAWHTHPLGQTLIVTAGFGQAQREGGPIEAIRPGDVVWFAPGEKHWHGASPTTAMTHIAIQENLDGKAVDWLEHVTDEQYRGE